MCWRRRGWGRQRRAATRLLSFLPAARSIGEHAGAVENKKVPPARCVHVGGLCAPDSRALTSDLGSSRLSPGEARPLFTQDATRGPRSCRAGVLPNPPFPDSRPLPRAANPAGGFSAGEPPPRPRPGPSGGDCGQAGRGAWRGGATGAGRARGGGRRPGPRPSRGLDLLTVIGPLVPRPLLGRAAPTLRQNPGEETRWLLSPPPFNFFFFSLGGEGGDERVRPADLQAPRQLQPSSESIVTRGPAAPFSPRYLSPSPLAARLAAGSPRACAPARPPARSRPLPVGLLCALEAPCLATFSRVPGGLR